VVVAAGMPPTREQERPRRVELVGDDAMHTSTNVVLGKDSFNVVNSDDLMPYLLLTL
jgi:hypothetical protein